MRVHNMRAQLKECDLKVDAPEAKGGAAKSNVLRIFQNGSASKVQAVIHTPQKWCSAVEHAMARQFAPKSAGKRRGSNKSEDSPRRSDGSHVASEGSRSSLTQKGQQVSSHL